MLLNYLQRLAGVMLVWAFLAVPGEAADFGTRISFKQNVAVPFATFTLTYLGERRVVMDKYPRGFVVHDFRLTSAQGAQTISWSAGTGDIGPTRFQVGGEGFDLELIQSDKLGPLKANEMVVNRAPR